jgi:hypothetical protein
VYLEVSASNWQLLAKLIPKDSERIQILHHAYTYGKLMTAFIVGCPNGKILFGLIVTFEQEIFSTTMASPSSISARIWAENFLAR